MRLISLAALAALVLFAGCDTDKPTPVAAPAPPADIDTPPDTPPPRLLLYANEDDRAEVEAALATPAVLDAVAAAPRFVPDRRRAFAVAGTGRGRDVRATFLPLFSETDPETVRLVVHARSGDVEAVHSALVRRSAPPVPGRFQPIGHLWVSLSDDSGDPDAGRWSDAQKSDFWNCIIDRSVTTVVSCAISCVFTAGGWLPCVVTCTSTGELTVVVGCIARVLVDTWRGRYDPREVR